jgi:ribosomal protein S18 acetylase RimI-like enzyme
LGFSQLSEIIPAVLPARRYLKNKLKIKLSKIPGSLDRESLAGFDASYSTDHIYRVAVNDLTVKLYKERLKSTLYRSYDQGDIEESIAHSHHTIVAGDKDKLVGFASVRFEEWNRRAIVGAIYVTPKYKGRGFGTSLIKEAVSYAKGVHARCLWLETQNVNYPAISFYLKSGFRFCGFDNSLYDPETVPCDEIALYFCLDLD